MAKVTDFYHVFNTWCMVRYENDKVYFRDEVAFGDLREAFLARDLNLTCATSA